MIGSGNDPADSVIKGYPAPETIPYTHAGVSVAGATFSRLASGQVTVRTDAVLYILTHDEWELVVRTLNDADIFFAGHPSLKKG